MTVDDPGSIDHAAFETALRSLLDQNPDALVAAINPDGIFVSVPPGITGPAHRVMRFRSALDIVVPADRVVILDCWERVRKTGGARGQVHLAGTDDLVTIHFLDVRERWGVYFCVVPAPRGTEIIDAIGENAPLVPRVTWTRKSEAAEFVEVDPAITKILGWLPEEMVGKRGLDFIHPDDQDRAIENWMAMLASSGDGQRTRLRHVRKDGSYVWMEFLNTNRLDDPVHHDVHGQMIDISDEMAAHEALRAREQLLNRLAEALPTGLLHLNRDRQVLYTNERLHQILGVAATSTVADQFRTVVREDWEALDRAIDEALAGADGDLEVTLRMPGTAERRLCHLTMRSLTEETGTVNAVIVTVSDVTESVRLRRELEERATFDALTRCYNRSTVMRILGEHIAGPTERIAAVFLDLDRFKAINDELGHAAGDELLVAAAERIRGAVRDHDVVGRIGGDEFLVVCPEVDGPDEAVQIAERVAAVVRREVTVRGVAVDMRSSVGVAWTTPDVTSADDLVARADAAMYESKRRSIGHAVAYTPALRRTDNVRLDDERALHHALGRGDLAVHFQPIVSLEDQRAVGFESLVRWTRAGTEGIPAADFIEMAEQTGLIHELGAHVRAEVIRGASETRLATGKERLWFLNISTHELQMPGIVESVLDLVETSALDPGSLVVEFNGTNVGDDVATVTRTAHAIHHAGVGIGLDDFGARGSSFDLLRALPLGWVKTCPTFTATMTFDTTSARIVETMLSLTTDLGVEAVVKGVETAQQRSLLLDMGARYGQGHLFAPAAPLGEILRVALET